MVLQEPAKRVSTSKDCCRVRNGLCREQGWVIGTRVGAFLLWIELVKTGFLIVFLAPLSFENRLGLDFRWRDGRRVQVNMS